MNQPMPVDPTAGRSTVRLPVAFSRSGHARAANAFATVLDEASTTGSASDRFEPGFDAAVRLYRRGEWRGAFAELSKCADKGNAPAAKLALLMLRYGAGLYGVTFCAQPAQVARWARCVLACAMPPAPGRRAA